MVITVLRGTRVLLGIGRRTAVTPVLILPCGLATNPQLAEPLLGPVQAPMHSSRNENACLNAARTSPRHKNEAMPQEPGHEMEGVAILQSRDAVRNA
jgi:hypothetical protein